ncbi:GSCFA domain-containing protein [Parvibaculum sp.]|uniref:GSCFA domain-containing protein n=1 Tax=Parvibaculum sp. TaxID=2024848 RepID=UPI001B27BC15|nr:GSCFA domain-containing protein [Parvibaculum sp.]MBO6669653.1 GSCFA domain-containing protein [Parvibaculum sp.]MBO6692708.1 GSCFA domain-containing protein [Parvibaculum sp.]
MKHPYAGVPDRQIWGKEPGISDGSLLDPVSDAPFRIFRQDRIVTAGSCFAQHLARFVDKAGFNHHVTESAHPVVPANVARKHNYGLFSARYGNIYTARQLRQLLQRAYGEFTPVAAAWRAPDGSGVVDPFRPQIQPGGFLSEAELKADREYHFRCIRRAIEEMDVFVFTLGLTEGWEDSRDGAVFPLAPGVRGGTYDKQLVRFVNFDVGETYADLKLALDFIRKKNPTVKIILTVSPVPLNATYEDRHVLLSSAWSKAVLRIAAERATKEFSDCVYFPSYEIVTSPDLSPKFHPVGSRVC